MKREGGEGGKEEEGGREGGREGREGGKDEEGGREGGREGLITVVTALTYPYKKNRLCFTGAIPRVTRLPVSGVSWG